MFLFFASGKTLTQTRTSYFKEGNHTGL